MKPTRSPLAKRFRGYLPVVVDVETSGFDPKTNALLEIAAVLLEMDGTGHLHPAETLHTHIKPFAGARHDESSLRFNGIDPFHPFRLAVEEGEALLRIFAAVEDSLRRHGCSRAILVGHNPAFDIAFLNAAATRVKISKNPFHSFTTFDTATLAGLAFGQTVLARAARAAGLGWNLPTRTRPLNDNQANRAAFLHHRESLAILDGTERLARFPEPMTSAIFARNRIRE